MSNEITGKELEGKSLSLLEAAQGIVVTDQKSYEGAAEFLTKIKAEIKKRVDFFAPMKKKTHEAWKAVCGQENDSIDPLRDADKIVRNSVKVYLDEQDRIRREEQRKAEEKARQEAERKRKELEARAASAKKDETKERLQAQAEEVFEEPVIVEHAVEKTTRLESGSVTRKMELKVDVLNPLEVIKAVARGDIPLTCVEIKPNKLKAWAKAIGIDEAKKKAAGCRVSEEANLSVR